MVVVHSLFTFFLAAGMTSAITQTVPNGRSLRDIGEADIIERIRHADVNKDGVITRSELLAHRQTEWPKLDRNDDGFFTRYDLPGFVRDRWDSGRLANMRQTYDADRDGRISRTEFTSGPTLAFDLVDANADGRVNEAEIKAALAEAKRR